MEPYVSIERLKLVFASTLPDSTAYKVVAMIDKFAIFSHGLFNSGRARRYVEVGVDLAVEGLEQQISRETSGKVRIDRAVHRLETTGFGRRVHEANGNRSIHRPRLA